MPSTRQMRKIQISKVMKAAQGDCTLHPLTQIQSRNGGTRLLSIFGLATKALNLSKTFKIGRMLILSVLCVERKHVTVVATQRAKQTSTKARRRRRRSIPRLQMSLSVCRTREVVREYNNLAVEPLGNCNNM